MRANEHSGFRGFGELVLGLSAALAVGCGRQQAKVPLVVLHCDELTVLFRGVEPVFEQASRGVDVRAESAPTVATIRKLTDLSRSCDLIATADPDLLRRMLRPKAAQWVAAFASDEIGIAAVDRSRYVHEMDADSWYQVLRRPDVSFARVDERLDPCGLYTLMAWRLADQHYSPAGKSPISETLAKACEPNNVRPSAGDLLTLLETPSGPDYVFVYRSVAEQHRLRFVALPEAINLGRLELANDYAKAQVTTTDQAGHEQVLSGRPVLFALAVPVKAAHPEEAIELARFLLDKPGQRALQRASLRPVVPARAGAGEVIPERLKPYVEAAE
jgi:molybdate/tungstate transport system substrate-binding protein